MPHHGQLATDDEVKGATRAGMRGAIVGAAYWGIYSALIAGAAYFYSPVYRGLTIQFKMFLQMSGMTAGAVIESERRLRDYEVQARRMRKLKRDQEAWRIYEQDFDRPDADKDK